MKSASCCLRGRPYLTPIFLLVLFCGQCVLGFADTLPPSVTSHTPRILETQDDFVQLKTSQILTVLLRFVHESVWAQLQATHVDSTSSAEQAPLQQWQLQPLLNYLSICVQGTSSNKRDVAVQCLEAILPRHEVRQAVWAIPGIVSGLEAPQLALA